MPLESKKDGDESGPVANARLPLPRNAAVDQRSSLAGQVYDHLRGAIVSLWLKPGEIIVEKAVAEQLHISRTPVREALMRLSDEGLVEIFPHSGTFVSQIKLQDVFEGQLVRDSLEMAVVRRAADRFTPEYAQRFDELLKRQRNCATWQDFEGFYSLDEEFHRTISECAGTPRIWRIINSAKAQLDRVRRLGMRVPGQYEQIILEHQAIVAGLKARDESAASNALKYHLDEVFNAIRVLLDRNSEYFSPESLSTGVDLAEPATISAKPRRKTMRKASDRDSSRS
jgi:GntR family transcriptional regulator, rspAB operon transcriptional repressor